MCYSPETPHNPPPLPLCLMVLHLLLKSKLGPGRTSERLSLAWWPPAICPVHATSPSLHPGPRELFPSDVKSSHLLGLLLKWPGVCPKPVLVSTACSGGEGTIGKWAPRKVEGYSQSKGRSGGPSHPWRWGEVK